MGLRQWRTATADRRQPGNGMAKGEQAEQRNGRDQDGRRERAGGEPEDRRRFGAETNRKRRAEWPSPKGMLHRPAPAPPYSGRTEQHVGGKSLRRKGLGGVRRGGGRPPAGGLD